MSYAWIIDTDHIADEDAPAPSNLNAVGLTGPSAAPASLLAAVAGGPPLRGAQVFNFDMRDDDGNLLYTGLMITTEGQSEEACYGPLRDFGAPNAGCTVIEYPGHPEMDCG